MKKKLLLLAISLVLLTGGFLIIKSQQASAAFNANNLIDDAVFDRTNSMSSAEIDAFLNGFPNSCISSNSGFQAIEPTGYSPGGGFQYGGYVSAGRVIFVASQVYGVNPQVLLVTLQKEQSLVAGGASYCNNGDEHKYAAAVGYGCPDSLEKYSYSNVNLYRRNGVTVTNTGVTCVNSSSKAGFSQQVIRAAWLLKFGQQRSMGNINWAVVGGNWNNSDDPQSCYGGPMTQGYRQVCPSGATTYYDGYRTIDNTPVHMDSGATAALYWYTPHFHGNQNFVSLFESWFGSVRAAPYSWQVVTQEVYSDASRTRLVDSGSLAPNTTYYLRVQARNIGSATWQTGVVNLATNNPPNHMSSMCDGSWLSCNRPATLKDAEVAPGGIGSFEFSVKIPNNYATYIEPFNLVAEGQTWFNDIGMFWALTARPPTYIWQMGSQEVFYDSGRTKAANSGTLAPNTTYYLRVRARNAGNATWHKGIVNLATNAPQNHMSSMCDGSWLGCNRPATLQETTVAPGDTGTFLFSIKTPNGYGTFIEPFNLVAEGQTWFNDIGMFWPLAVQPPTYVWQYGGQTVYTNSTKSTPANPSAISNGSRFYMVIQARNVGNAPWTQGITNLATSNPNDHTSSFCDVAWLACNRPGTVTQSTVAPGDTGTFEFWLTAPFAVNGSNYKEYFNLVQEGQAWFNDLGMHQGFTMQSSDHSWQYVSQAAYSDSARTQVANLGAATPNTTYYLRLKAKNIGGQVWHSGQINLGTSNPQNRTSQYCNGSWLSCNRAATLKETSIVPGATGTFEFSITTPATPGTANEYFNLVQEGQAWFNDLGQHWTIVTN